MKRIGIDARMMGKAQASGIGNYIQQIVTRIISKDHGNQYFIFVKPENRHLADWNLPHVSVIETSCHWYSLCEQTKFLKLLNSLNLDLVHFPQFNVPLFYFRPFVTTIHDVTPLIFPGHKRSSWLRNLAFRLVFNKALRASKKIMVVSEYTKSEISRFFTIPSHKIDVTKLGIEKDFLVEPNYAKIKEIQARFQITKPYLFFVGAWRSHKNIEGLISAFVLLKNNYHLDWQLVLGGKEDPGYPQISRLINSLPNTIRKDIIIPGFISEQDLPSVYRASLAYIIPSYLEGFGINGLEAMASHTPVICSKTGSLPEIYKDAAVYFNPASSEEMAEKIFQTATNEDTRAALVNKGLARIKEFDWETTAQQTLDCYHSILGR